MVGGGGVKRRAAYRAGAALQIIWARLTVFFPLW
jgi:hypothetical protein